MEFFGIIRSRKENSGHDVSTLVYCWARTIGIWFNSTVTLV